MLNFLFEDGVVTNIHLDVKGLVPKIQENRFKELAEYAKIITYFSVLIIEILLTTSLL